MKEPVCVFQRVLRHGYEGQFCDSVGVDVVCCVAAAVGAAAVGAVGVAALIVKALVYDGDVDLSSIPKGEWFQVSRSQWLGQSHCV